MGMEEEPKAEEGEAGPAETAREVRYNAALAELRRIDPYNRALQSVGEPGAKPTESDVERVEEALVNARWDLSMQIAEGHAAAKHAEDFSGIGSTQQLAQTVERIIASPSRWGDLSDGRSWYTDEKFIVIVNPNDPDGGSVYIPNIPMNEYIKTLK